MANDIARRKFIATLGGMECSRGRSPRAHSRANACGASACSCRMRADDPDGQAFYAAFLQGLEQLGWTDGRNVHIDTRWGAGNADDIAQIRGGIGRAWA